jgi:hypothetical protein
MDSTTARSMPFTIPLVCSHYLEGASDVGAGRRERAPLPAETPQASGDLIRTVPDWSVTALFAKSSRSGRHGVCERPPVNEKRHVAAVALVAAACVASSPALPQVSPASQETCAGQAETVFRERGYSKGITRPKGDDSGNNDVIANFESHYNKALDKCFILLEIFGIGLSNAGFHIRSLLDAYDGRSYAEFAWGPTESKKYWEVRPYCRLMASPSDESSCNSEAEFNAFIARYME